MLTISQLAAYAGVTVRAVRHYHQIGLLPEPERDASGYRRYGATGGRVPDQDPHPRQRGRAAVSDRRAARSRRAAFAEAVQRIDGRLRDEIERLETSRKQIAQLAAGDSLVVPPEVACYLDRLREIGASERIVQGERDGWILVAARWPDLIREWMPDKLAQLEDPRLVRLYRLLSEIAESDAGDDDPRAGGGGRHPGRPARAGVRRRRGASRRGGARRPAVRPPGRLAVESDPRMERMQELMRERGWAGWTRLERLEEPPG